MEHTCGGVRSLQMRSSYIQIATPILFGSNSPPPSLLHSRQKYLCLSAYAGGFMRRCHFVSSVPHMSARCPQGKTHVRWHSLCLGLHSWPNSPRARHSRLLILPFFLIMYAIISGEHMFFFSSFPWLLYDRCRQMLYPPFSTTSARADMKRRSRIN